MGNHIWYRVLEPGERLLWTGQPDYGRRLFEATNSERKIHLMLLVGVAIIWLSIAFAKTSEMFPDWIATACTILALRVSAAIAYDRRVALRLYFFAVTDHRAILCKEGRDVLFRPRLLVLLRPHITIHDYPISWNAPYPTLRIGTSLMDEMVHIRGGELSNLGQPPLMSRTFMPLLFEHIRDAEAMHEFILAQAERFESRR